MREGGRGERGEEVRMRQGKGREGQRQTRGRRRKRD
jgi:hypothetical protein